MADKTTVHHLLFPRAMWNRKGPYNSLRTTFVIKLPKTRHEILNDWIDQTIGFIPLIPPREITIIHYRIRGFTGTLPERLAHLINTIHQVATESPNPTVREVMSITARNLELQGQYLGILPEHDDERSDRNV